MTERSYQNFTVARPHIKLIVAGIVGVCVLVASILIIGMLQPSAAQRKQQKLDDQATAAVQKQAPNAQANSTKVADGFALATVIDKTADGQGSAGMVTIFKVSKTGSMTQLASGSSFSPIDLLGLGLSLSTQSKLTNQTIGQLQQTIADQCNYSGGDTPGYSGFNGSFSPGGWKISPALLDTITIRLSHTISAQNNQRTNNQKIVCLNAIPTGSASVTDQSTYITTYTLEIQYITTDGTLSTHTLTYNDASTDSQPYTLDGQALLLQ